MSSLNSVIVTYTSPIEVVETVGGKTHLTGTLIRLDVPTGNGRIYRFEEAEKIAHEAVGKPVRIGVDWKREHVGFTKETRNQAEKVTIGKILKAWVDRAKKAVKGVIEIANTTAFPRIVQEVKRGWAFSVGGFIDGFQLLSKAGRLLMKCLNFAIDHLQLLRPNEPRGDRGAVVEMVASQPVGESISFSQNPLSYLVLDTDPFYRIKGSGVRRVRIRER
jgi:hypothetical protein